MYSFDFKQVVESSSNLFKMLNLDSWATEVDKHFEIDSCEADVLELMKHHHLNYSIIMPSYRFQIEHAQELAECLKSGIEKIGYTSFISDSYKADATDKFLKSDFNITQRYDKPYALFYTWDMHHKCTYGLSGHQVKNLFQQNGWTGMTSEEFMVTQSRSVTFAEPHGKLWTWLVDSSNDGMTSVGFLDKSSLKVYTCKKGSTHDARGALVTCILPLREVKEYKRE